MQCPSENSPTPPPKLLDQYPQSINTFQIRLDLNRLKTQKIFVQILIIRNLTKQGRQRSLPTAQLAKGGQTIKLFAHPTCFRNNIGKPWSVHFVCAGAFLLGDLYFLLRRLLEHLNEAKMAKPEGMRLRDPGSGAGDVEEI